MHQYRWLNAQQNYEIRQNCTAADAPEEDHQFRSKKTKCHIRWKVSWKVEKHKKRVVIKSVYLDELVRVNVSEP